MILSFATISLDSYGLDRIFKIVKEVGYDGIDIFCNSSLDTQSGSYLKELSNRYNVPITGIVIRNNKSQKDIMRGIKLVQQAECKTLIVPPPSFFNFTHVNWLKKNLPKLRKEEKIDILVMNVKMKTLLWVLPTHSFASIEDLKKLKDLCIDTSNVFANQQSIISVYEKIKPNLKHIFLSNVKSDGQSHYLPMEGQLPIESFLIRLKKNDYKGVISVVVKSKFLDVKREAKVKENLLKIKEFIKKF